MTLPYVIETKREHHLVTKSNVLIEANYKLGVVEQKIILCLVSNIQPHDSDFKTYTLPIKEFNQLLGLKGTPKYTELRAITREMMKKVFEIRIEKKVIQVAWLSYVAYNESEGTIDIRFDPFLRPYLLELKKNFTTYKLENVMGLRSSYAIRIYELLKQYEKIKERAFTVSDLRKVLGAEEIYPAYGNFKQRVLIPAQKELKAKTDIAFEIEEFKQGRRVEKIKFVITSKKSKVSQQLNLFEDNLEDFQRKSFTEKAKKIATHIGFKLNDKVLNAWEETYGQDRILEVMYDIKDRKDIQNYIGYITSILKATELGNESPAEMDSQDIKIHLVSIFKKSKEAIPEWFLKKKAIEELQEHFNLEESIALVKFNEIREELFSILGIQESGSDTITEEEFIREKEELELLLKS
ncbi:MAG: replication initiation protein [Heyndrickxia sp.]